VVVTSVARVPATVAGTARTTARVTGAATVARVPAPVTTVSATTAGTSAAASVRRVSRSGSPTRTAPRPRARRTPRP
jgi:hypothetical protein